MSFNPELFSDEKLETDNKTIYYRAYKSIPYVSNPAAAKLQVLDIYIPSEYLLGGTINGYNSNTAPIFFPHAIGGYMEAKPCSPSVRDGYFNTEARAIERGYVVISAGARGRTTVTNGTYVGKAPACIIDLKAAVRFIRSISDRICGDTEKIISNGTSAGGAISALLGSSGDSELFLPYLTKMGAEATSDRIFAASCYCPITNLENADMPYEWQYGHLKEQFWSKWEPEGDSYKITPMHTFLTDEQMRLSAQLRDKFPKYLNSLSLVGMNLDANGEGSFKEYIKSLLLASAERAFGEGKNIPKESGINLSQKTINFDTYCAYITRMKAPCAFDNPDMYTPENQLFGTGTTDKRHFTPFGYSNSNAGGEMAETEQIHLMNALNFVDHKGCVKHWRIRHGASDRDTSFAISAILAEKLAQQGKSVDYFLPWNIPHSGDYDLDQLFDWIDDISQS